MANILITGSTGFIGTHLKKNLAETHSLILPSRTELNDHSIFEQADIIIHLAGKAHDVEFCNIQEYTSSNTDLTINLFNHFLTSHAKTFIFMSSILVLGSCSDIPLTETMPPNPQTPYSISKQKAEEYIFSKELPAGKKVFVIRIPLVYGNGHTGNLKIFYKFMQKLFFWPLGSIESKRSLCDIRNLIFAINCFIETKGIENGIYHICDNNFFRLSEIYNAFCISIKRDSYILCIPHWILNIIFKILSLFDKRFVNQNFKKLTSSLLVSNHKFKESVKIDFPYQLLSFIVYFTFFCIFHFNIC